MPEENDVLNPFSASFDAQQFLNASETTVQNALPSARDRAVFRKAQPLNYTGLCQSVETTPFRLLSQAKVYVQKKESVTSEKRNQNDGRVRNVLQMMHEKFKVGPLSLLERAVRMRQRIRVIVRDTHAIKGGIVGRLVAFDRHFNLVLAGVERRGLLFVRGENVVLVEYNIGNRQPRESWGGQRDVA